MTSPGVQLSRRAALALIIATVAGCGGTRAYQADRRLRMMVPNTPGGGYDITARTAVEITESLGITDRVPVFNVIGAGGSVAMARLMNESGNGELTVMMGLGVVGATVTSRSAARVSTATPIAGLIEEQEALMVRADAPYRTVEEFVAAWRADPGGLIVGGGSLPGGPDHLFPMQLARTLGIAPTAVRYVAYDGGGDLLPPLLNSEIAVASSSLGEYAEQVRSGQLRVLAVSGATRLADIDAPTLTESGVDLIFTNWRGVLAPPGIADDEREALIGIFTALHASAEWQAALVHNGWTDAFRTGDDFGTFLADQEALVTSTLAELGLA